MADPQVIILGNYDIYDLGYVTKLANISEQKTFQKDKLINNTYNLSVDNSDDFFSINNTNSIFSDINWLYNSINIINGEGEYIWNGIITNIS